MIEIDNQLRPVISSSYEDELMEVASVTNADFDWSEDIIQILKNRLNAYDYAVVMLGRSFDYNFDETIKYQNIDDNLKMLKNVLEIENKLTKFIENDTDHLYKIHSAAGYDWLKSTSHCTKIKWAQPDSNQNSCSVCKTTVKMFGRIKIEGHLSADTTIPICMSCYERMNRIFGVKTFRLEIQELTTKYKNMHVEDSMNIQEKMKKILIECGLCEEIGTKMNQLSILLDGKADS